VRIIKRTATAIFRHLILPPHTMGSDHSNKSIISDLIDFLAAK